MRNSKTVTAKVEVEGQQLQVDLDLGFPEDGGPGSYALNEAWKTRAGLSSARMEGVQAWLDDVNAAGERIEHEQFLAHSLRTRFTTFMEAQGFSPVFDADDGTRIFERAGSEEGPAEALAVRSLHGLEFQFKKVEPGLAEEELDGSRARDGFPPVSFDGLEGETRSLAQFMSAEGLTSTAEMVEELRAWRRTYESSYGLPNPLGVRQRLTAGVALSGNEQVAHAEAFAAVLSERGFKQVGVYDGLPLHVRPAPGGGPGAAEHLVWRIGPDGEPAYKRFAQSIQELPFGYESLDSAERDFSAFLRQERLPPERLPSRYALSLPFEQGELEVGRSLEMEHRRPARQPAVRGASDGMTGETVAGLPEPPRTVPFPIDAFLRAQAFRQVDDLGDGVRIFFRGDNELTSPWRRESGGDYLAVRDVPGRPLAIKFMTPAEVQQHAYGDELPLPYDKLEGKEHGLYGLAGSFGLPRLAPEEQAREILAWTEWAASDRPLPPLRGVHRREREGGLASATEELAAAKAFASSLERDGYRSYDPTARREMLGIEPPPPTHGPVVAQRLTGSERELVIWQLGGDGKPVWKQLSADLGLSVEQQIDGHLRVGGHDPGSIYLPKALAYDALLGPRGFDAIEAEARRTTAIGARSSGVTHVNENVTTPAHSIAADTNEQVGDATAFLSWHPAALRQFLTEHGFNHHRPVTLSDGTQLFEKWSGRPGAVRVFAVHSSPEYVAVKTVGRELLDDEVSGQRHAAGLPEPTFQSLPGQSLSLSELLHQEGVSLAPGELASWRAEYEARESLSAARLTADEMVAHGRAFEACLDERGFSRAFYSMEIHGPNPEEDITFVPIYERRPQSPAGQSEYLGWTVTADRGVTFKTFTREELDQANDGYYELGAPARPFKDFLDMEGLPADRRPPSSLDDRVLDQEVAAHHVDRFAALFAESPTTFTTFLASQRFVGEGWLADGTRIYFRPDHEEPLLPSGLQAGELMAAKFTHGGQLRWRTTSREEIAAANGYADLRQPEQDLLALLNREGLRSASELERELGLWQSWQDKPQRMPPEAIVTHLEREAERGGGAQAASLLEHQATRSERLDITGDRGESSERLGVGLEGLVLGGAELPNGTFTPPAADLPDDGTRPSHARVSEAQHAGPKALDAQDRSGASARPEAVLAVAPVSFPDAARLDPPDGPLSPVEAFGAGAAEARLRDERAAAAAPLAEAGGFATGQLAGLITYGPERSPLGSPGEPQRLVLWAVDPDTGTGAHQAVMFHGAFAKALNSLRPGDFIHVEGFTRRANAVSLDSATPPWTLWATKLTPPGAHLPLAPYLPEGPPSDQILRDSFGQPHLQRNGGGIATAPSFLAALREPMIRIRPAVEQTALATTLSSYVKQRGLSPMTEEILRLSLRQRAPELPLGLGLDLQAWSASNARGHFVAEAPADALSRRFAGLAAVNSESLERLGISRSTLDARQFRGSLREGAAGACAALTRNEGGVQGIMEVPLQPLGRASIASGNQQGLWISGPGERPCSRIVIAATPVAALAFHERHPDPHSRYIAIGADTLTSAQQVALERFLAEQERETGGRPELIVACHHKSAGRKLLQDVAAVCRQHQVTGMMPPPALGGSDWIEATRRARQPELLVNLPAYAESRLGFECLLRTADGKQVVMGRPENNVPLEPRAVQVDGRWVLKGPAVVGHGPVFAEKLMFVREPDGSWSFQNDRAHATDRGSAADFARTRLQLTLEEFRSDLRRFGIEQSLQRANPLQPTAHELNVRGIYPDTIAGPCFRGALRQDEAGRLVFAHQDARGLCGFQRMPIGEERGEFRGSLEGEQGVWMSSPRPGREAVNKIVFVDTPLTALAYHQQNPSERVRYIATGPLSFAHDDAEYAALSPAEKQACGQRELTAAQKAAVYAAIRAAEQSGPVELVACASRGQPGKQFTVALVASGVGPVQPHPPAFGRDWLESVEKRERGYIRSLGGGRDAKSLSL